MSTRPTQKRPFLLGLTPLLAVSLATASLAQSSASQPAPAAAPSATTPSSATPVFEVAAIKPNHSGSGNSNSDTDKGLFTATNVSLKGLMQYEAYDIPPSRILGGPKWLDSARFDIQAKTDETVTDRLQKLDHEQNRLQTRAMFQQFLADRFQLRVHWETRELPVYALVATKNGAKLQPTKDTSGNSGTSTNGNGSSMKFTATAVTLAQLTQALTSEAARDLGREVIDKTGIAGKYDVSLNWTHDTSTAPDGSAQDSSISIFTAIQEQLGLKLESTKGPVQVLVIDHAEMPSEN
ncbi:TIGR03435 family protein [Acidicapsa ligni]|uniref:TIGR03435 family protein n=1 Tax=Acidicapsa ligni TaxID=542300 RepID=UPI0021DF60D7|nr:TIGR03435 family protein [Acidicapsa ligni]